MLRERRRVDISRVQLSDRKFCGYKSFANRLSLAKSQKFLSRKNFPLYGTWINSYIFVIKASVMHLSAVSYQCKGAWSEPILLNCMHAGP